MERSSTCRSRIHTPSTWAPSILPSVLVSHGEDDRKQGWVLVSNTATSHTISKTEAPTLTRSVRSGMSSSSRVNVSLVAVLCKCASVLSCRAPQASHSSAETTEAWGLDSQDLPVSVWFASLGLSLRASAAIGVLVLMSYGTRSITANVTTLEVFEAFDGHVGMHAGRQKVWQREYGGTGGLVIAETVIGVLHLDQLLALASCSCCLTLRRAH